MREIQLRGMRTKMPALPAQWCQGTECRRVITEITQREIVVNTDRQRFYVPPTADLEVVRRVVRGAHEEFEAFVREHWKSLRRRASLFTKWRELLRAFDRFRTHAELLTYLDDLMNTALTTDYGHTYQRVLKLFTQLWAVDQLAFPYYMPRGRRFRFELDATNIGRHFQWQQRLREDCRALGNVSIQRLSHAVLTEAQAALFIHELADITPSVVDPKDFGYAVKASGFEVLSLAQARAYPDQKEFIRSLWPSIGFKVGSKGDPTFAWALTHHPDLDAWVRFLATWARDSDSQANCVRAGDVFLDYLSANPRVTRNPVEYCRLNYACGMAFDQWISDHRKGKRTDAIAGMRRAFDWLLKTMPLTPRNDEPALDMRPFGNPIALPEPVQRPDETRRNRLPTRFIRELIRIIEDDDYAWPKSLEEDYFPRLDPNTQAMVQTWSPVRAVAALTKLRLPFRTFQTRMLESSEGDTLRCFTEIDDQGERRYRWRPNDLPHAPQGRAFVQRGFLRRIVEDDDETGARSELVGLFVNTNKTQKRKAHELEAGYPVPWEHHEVIASVQMLERFQTELNPVSGPTAWRTLKDRHLKQQGKPRPGSAFFLFRDPCDKRAKNEPVSAGRMNTFWLALLDELEKRLAKRGEARQGGEPYRFILSRHAQKGHPTRSAYPLHSLRVSVLKALHKDGGVPVEILRKALAGHASILMTMYYLKTTAVEVNDALAAAQRGIDANEASDFDAFRRQYELDRAQPVGTAFALKVASEHERSGFVDVDIGFCPVGGQACDQGGPKVNGKHTVVPGRARNCVRCRFFVTTAEKAIPLENRLNGLALSFENAVARHRTLEREIEAMEVERARCQRQNKIYPQNDTLDRLGTRLETLEQQVMDIVADMDAAYAMAQRLVEAGKKRVTQPDPKSPHLDLLLGGTTGDLNLSMKLTSQFRLLERICQNSVIHPVEETQVATLQLSRMADAMLARAQMPQRFSLLDPNELLSVTNQFVALLQLRLGDSATEALMMGQRTLTAADRALIEQPAAHKRIPAQLLEETSDA